MRVVYVAHPVSGAVAANLAKARRWVRWIESKHSDVAVVASWIIECEIWDDSDPAQREAGLRRNLAVIDRCDELWLVGGRLSTGMALERDRALTLGKSVMDLLHLGDEPPASAL